MLASAAYAPGRRKATNQNGGHDRWKSADSLAPRRLTRRPGHGRALGLGGASGSDGLDLLDGDILGGAELPVGEGRAAAVGAFPADLPHGRRTERVRPAVAGRPAVGDAAGRRSAGAGRRVRPTRTSVRSDRSAVVHRHVAPLQDRTPRGTGRRSRLRSTAHHPISGQLEEAHCSHRPSPSLASSVTVCQTPTSFTCCRETKWVEPPSGSCSPVSRSIR